MRLQRRPLEDVAIFHLLARGLLNVDFPELFDLLDVLTCS